MKGNRYLSAFKEQHNLIGLSTAVAASMALMNPLPLLVGLVAEAAYLMFYADSRWYAARLARRFDDDVAKRREELRLQIFPQLSPAMRERFERLENVRRDIDHQAQDDAQWFREVLRKLDFLLEKFLHFASKEAQFRDYLQAARNQAQPSRRVNAPPHSVRAAINSTLNPVPPAPRSSLPSSLPGSGSGPLTARGLSSNGASNGPDLASTSSVADAATRWVRETVEIVQQSYDGSIAQIAAQAEQARKDSDDVTGAVLEKRLEVLKRRREFVGRIGRIQINLDHQLALVEDTFGLISDELRARPPEQVLADIEDVVSQTNTMTQLLEEVAPLEQLLSH